ncbi:MAG TPA: DinB family protein [Pyrinomonadaceae bacterium]|jgi:uncharacterized damage-inducible protein DinB
MQFIVNIIKKNVGREKAADIRQSKIESSFRRLAKAAETILPMLLLLLSLFASAAIVSAQNKPAAVATPPANPLSDWNRRAQSQMKAWLLGSAEKMSEENYNFKPTEAVRSYGQIIGHIADGQYIFCSAVLGEKNPGLKIEKTKTTKLELIAALKESYAYCDKAYNDLTDATAAQLVKHNKAELPKLFLLNMNITHASLHYGNLITYMRLKNIIPPSTER